MISVGKISNDNSEMIENRVQKLSASSACNAQKKFANTSVDINELSSEQLKVVVGGNDKPGNHGDVPTIPLFPFPGFPFPGLFPGFEIGTKPILIGTLPRKSVEDQIRLDIRFPLFFNGHLVGLVPSTRSKKR